MKRLIVSLALVGILCLTCVGFAQDTVNLRRTVVVEVVQRTKDAVVNISARKVIIRRVSPFPINPFWEGFGPSELVRVPANSLGSGFIVHPDGYVVTNNHVIDRATEITVELADGRKLPATLISSDPEADLAILKITDSKPFPCVELGDSSDLMIGEPAIAVGNPLGYSHTVSTGIVSALDRDIGEGENRTLTGLIQTDAAINPGNSGGPLLNAYGQVIGINTAIRSDAQNIGFAIQVNHLRELIPELMNPAQAAKVNIPLQLSETRTLTEPDGIACKIVSADKPPRAIDTINGVHPQNIIDAYAMLLRVKANDHLQIAWQDGSTQSLLASAVPVPVADETAVQARRLLGMDLEAVTPDLAKKFELSANEGLLVQFVSSDSAAAKSGLQPGDVILAIGRYRMSSMDDLSPLLPRLSKAPKAVLVIDRGDQLLYVPMDLGD
jgi:serine protease Do